jgi:hypothetical protein
MSHLAKRLLASSLLAALIGCGEENCILAGRSKLDILYRGIDGSQVNGGLARGRYRFRCGSQPEAVCAPDRLVFDVRWLNFVLLAEVEDFPLDVFFADGSTVSSTVAITRTSAEVRSRCGGNDTIVGAFP